MDDPLRIGIEAQRAETDASLDAERGRTDRAVESSSRITRQHADDVIERDRQNADEKIRKLREAADRSAASSELPRGVERERAVKEALVAERSATDAVLERERARVDDAIGIERARDDARESIVERRNETDDKLATERDKGDSVLSMVHAQQQTLQLTSSELARRREILAVVAHDLRNPILIVSLNAQLLAKAAPSAETRELAEEIERACARMNRLVSDLLDVARIDADAFRMSIQELDLARLLREIHGSYEPLFASRHLSLSITGASSQCLVDADCGRLTQAISNILSNALKFTPPAGHVLLKLVQHGALASIEVSDSGPGIPAANLALVTRRFWQEDHQNQRGLGLGLYIVDRIVAAHGGQLAVESSPGSGTTVRITLATRLS